MLNTVDAVISILKMMKLRLREVLNYARGYIVIRGSWDWNSLVG